ncbi:HD domain-containing protein [Bacillus sp. 1P06AnD]|uniref:HD domain-containing protein n=1 Tax=Bacillus sp. 1P06AnD TaxID=3132208 RepID=UPI0039A01CE5
MDRVNNALTFATNAHAGQTRKNSSEPYIEHPKRVSFILKQANLDEDIVIAGLLHDTVEDTPVTIEDIQAAFGDRVAEIVASHTENKALSWEERKKHTIETVKAAPMEIKALIVADKLDNIRSLVEQYGSLGENMWKAFKRGPDKQAWYNRSVADAIKEVDNPPAFFTEYRDLVAEFFNK